MEKIISQIITLLEKEQITFLFMTHDVNSKREEICVTFYDRFTKEVLFEITNQERATNSIHFTRLNELVKTVKDWMPF